MSAASANDVRASLHKLLPTVDIDATTEREIREKLAAKLGTSMDPFKKLIKEEIDIWLTTAPVGVEGSAGDDGLAQDMPSSLDPVGSRKRGAAAAAAGEKPAKVARGSEGGPEGIQLDNQGNKWLSVSTFKGQQRVDIRTFYRTPGGALAPTKKGISLNHSQWSALTAAVEAVSKAVDDWQEDFSHELSNNVCVTTSVFNGKLQVGIREYYQSGREMRPSQKGINLAPDEWDVLCESIPDITQQLGAPPPAAPAAAAAPAAEGGSKAGASRGGGAAAAAGAKSARGGAAAAAAGSSSDAVEVQLGGNKRAAISTFTGSKNVDLRECYNKDGQMMPGKKGIMLKPDQWSQLTEAAEAVTSALTAHNTRYVLELGNKRRVTISEFKGVWYVGVREFYEAGGELKPGSKGLSMNREQWQKLVAAMDSLSAQL